MTTCTHASAGCDYPASECAMSKQPAALHYAEVLEGFYLGLGRLDATGAAAELRRLHAENAELTARLAHATERALIHKERADKLQTHLDTANKACSELAAQVDDLLKQRDHWHARLLAEVGKHNKLEVSK